MYVDPNLATTNTVQIMNSYHELYGVSGYVHTVSMFFYLFIRTFPFFGHFHLRTFSFSDIFIFGHFHFRTFSFSDIFIFGHFGIDFRIKSVLLTTFEPGFLFPVKLSLKTSDESLPSIQTNNLLP
jgi:hypothetical protein